MDPPGEGAALDRPGFIDGAFVFFEEDAVVGVWGVDKDGLIVDDADIAFEELFFGELEMGRECGEIAFGKADVAGGVWIARAAFAAAGAFESKALFKPGFRHE